MAYLWGARLSIGDYRIKTECVNLAQRVFFELNRVQKKHKDFKQKKVGFLKTTLGWKTTSKTIVWNFDVLTGERTCMNSNHEFVFLHT